MDWSLFGAFDLGSFTIIDLIAATTNGSMERCSHGSRRTIGGYTVVGILQIQEGRA